MKKPNLSVYLWLTSAAIILVTYPVYADEIVIKDIPKLSDIQRPHTNTKDWLAQQTEIISVTEVRLSQTSSGLEIILKTPTSDKLQVTNKTERNNFIADIPNIQLRLTSGDSFRQEKPIAGITEVTVSNINTNSIRVTVTGEAGVPKVELDDSDEGLIFVVTPNKPTSETPATQPSAEANQPIELTVTGERDGYNVPTATTGTKIEAPLRDLPLSIQVIPRQVIEDRGVVRLNDLADNVAGVQQEPGYGSLPSVGFRIRGFTTNFGNLRNGFQDFGYVTPRDIANVEQFEILKGPASVLYGGGQSVLPSGVVNAVTKKPLEQPYYNASVKYGSYNFLRSTIDLTGPLTEDKSLLYRLNVAYENADSFRDFTRNDSFFIAPALTWKIGPRTNLALEFEYQNYNLNFNYGFLPEPEFLTLPRNRFLGEPNFNASNVNSTAFTYNFEHEFSDNWKFRQGFNLVQANLNSKSTFLFALEDDRRTANINPSTSDEVNDNLTLQNEIIGKFKTGFLRHNLLFGIEFSRYKFDYNFTSGDDIKIDIFNPQYGANIVLPSSPTRGRKFGSDNIALYIQDFIEVLPNLKILAGGRFDSNELFRNDTVTNTTINEQSNSQFSPRVGIVYQPSQTTSLYFNWSNSFFPNFSARSRTDEQFKPEIGEQFEVGIKQDLIKDRLSATLAFYQITRQNVLTPDPVDPQNFSITTGEQRSRGVELDITGQILPGWNIIANYAYTDAVVTKDEDIPVGSRLYGVPENSASLWTTYQIQSGNLQGLGFGLGLAFVGEQETRLPSTLTLPSYVRADAAIFYRRDRYKIGLNFKNISNVRYYTLDGYFIYPAAPFTVQGTVSFDF
ncbi:TonB-dependent siderophore receptor (plasmid) [Nostoc edaphicum CCNP1411]|uniref:TonB-dependent siderophore receptor n=1 Tax=Nostoc edaphicum CCNP1411 TaxID=1472755 RepID=A0A7D7LAE0_9NOSO|nr:TonB-dependent siderophore receptor [Nostoc edaphicum]QMS86509.1 TonB-dependent siderophore receptor [Nostoc edaphicum CCNP1411]